MKKSIYEAGIIRPYIGFGLGIVVKLKLRLAFRSLFTSFSMSRTSSHHLNLMYSVLGEIKLDKKALHSVTSLRVA